MSRNEGDSINNDSEDEEDEDEELYSLFVKKNKET